MIIEGIFIAILAFAMGTYGTQSKIKASVQNKVTSTKVWTPAAHTDMLQVCSRACGQGRMKGYNTFHGSCDCGD